MSFEGQSKSNWKFKADAETEKPEIKTEFEIDPNYFNPNMFDAKSNLHLNCIYC